MKTKWLSALIALLASANLALAQTPAGTIGTVGDSGAYNSVNKTCTDGSFCYLQTDVNGQLKVTGSFSSSTAGFAPATTGTPISVTTGGVTGTLPAGAVVVASNVGATNGAYCKLGASATTSDQLIPPNSWFAFTVGVATQLTCITSTSTTTVNMVGGSGLPTGAGGGGGSGTLTNYALETGGNLATIATNTAASVPTTQSGASTALISCDSHVFKHITSATDTLAVQGVTAKTVYVCGWRARAAGVATWFLENTASTNANCSSSNTQITGVATEAANTGEVMNPAFWSGLKNTAGNGLCINSTGTGGVDIDIFYTQF